MPSDLQILPEHKLVISRGLGTFTRADHLEHVEMVRNDPQFSPEFRQVIDCRRITQMLLSMAEVRELASQSIFSRKSPRVFLVESEIQYGLSRAFGSFREIEAGQDVQVFRTVDEVLAWLRLPAEVEEFFRIEEPV